MPGYGDVVKRVREERGLSQEQLADLANVSRDTMGRAEKSENVGVFALISVAAALGVHVRVFFGGKSSGKPPSVWSRLSAKQRAYVEKVAAALVESGE